MYKPYEHAAPMLGLKDRLKARRVQRMLAAACLAFGVLVCAITIPPLVEFTHRADFQVHEFWQDAAAFEGLLLLLGLGCIVTSWQIFARTKTLKK